MNERETLRLFVEENIDEGIIRGVGSLAATPFRAAGTVAKTVGRTAVAPVAAGAKLAGGGLKAAGQLATLRPGAALKTIKKTGIGVGKSLAKPVTGLAKDVSGMVTKPIKALRKGGVVY